MVLTLYGFKFNKNWSICMGIDNSIVVLSATVYLFIHYITYVIQWNLDKCNPQERELHSSTGFFLNVPH